MCVCVCVCIYIYVLCITPLQAEGARAARSADEATESGLRGDVEAAQRECDRERFRLLREHGEAVAAALPEAEAAQVRYI